MKIPDKIWVTPSEMTELLSEKRHDYDVAYIRKDALMEKLEKVAASYKKRSDEGELVWQNMCGIKEAIDLLNSM